VGVALDQEVSIWNWAGDGAVDESRGVEADQDFLS
jgi:hypothetical protein